MTPSSTPVARDSVAVLPDPDAAATAPRGSGDAAAPAQTRAGGRGRRTAEPVRGDIQGLRALAVLVVLIFHFWPTSLTGGYVGVDVFFVISGFLITSHLLRSPPTTPRLLGQFWARRVRRLLPAASLVLGVTLLASIVWMPSTQLPGIAREAIASALSVENWALANSATDYLAADSAPSPLQHYWSLSVEEQFYVLWPVLIALLALVSRGRRAQTWWAAGLIGVTAASFAASVLLTRADPAGAYFVTHTRVWELGLGSLLALAVFHGWRLRSSVVRAGVAWLGLAMIIVAALRFDGTTPFPGTAALLPTVGAALLIAADTDSVRWSPRALLTAPVSQRLGDLSYSVYLWHWPVVVIAPYALGRDLTFAQTLVAIAAVIVLSGLTKRYVEDPVRRSRTLARSLPRSFAIAVASVVVITAASVTVITRADTALAAEQEALTAKLDQSLCVGAEAARNPGCTSFIGEELLTSPAVARADRSVLYADGCWSNRPYTAHKVCTYGQADSDVRVALIGNSHAGHWQPTLAPIAEEQGWALDTYLVSQCYTVDLPLEFGSERLTENCRSWNEWALGEVSSGAYDLVILSNRSFQDVVDVPPAEQGPVTQRAYEKTLETITDSGTPALVLRDTPSARKPAPDCVAANLADVTVCSDSEAKAVELDPLHDAALADSSGLVSTLDLSDRFCRDDRCQVVIGGLIAYFDHGHLTTTFARTLVPDVAPAVTEALAARPS